MWLKHLEAVWQTHKELSEGKKKANTLKSEHYKYKKVFYFMGMTIPVKNKDSGILQWHSEDLKTAQIP